MENIHDVCGEDEPPLTSYLVLEDRTDDLAANSGNAERMWMRSDLTSPTVKGVISYNMRLKHLLFPKKTIICRH